MPYFSIIIPVYNVAPYLRECLDSVLKQTFTDWEAICVDDGSTDESGAILDEYAAKDKRFRVIHQANAGVSAARNKALDVAKGEWIGFIDSDDKVSESWVLAWKRCIEARPNADIFKFKNRSMIENLQFLDYNEFSIKDYISPNGGAEYVCTHINGYTPWLYVMRRQTVGNCRFIQGVRVNEDVLFISQLLFTAATLCVCSYDGYFYRHRASSALGSGVTDDDMVLFLKGIVKTVDQVSLVMDEELFGRYQTWVARRVLSDIKGCLLIKGVNPSRSIPLFKSLMSNKVINCANLLLKEKLLLILMKLGALGYRIVIGYYACRRKLSKLRKGHL